jgi:uncharacterized SAM-binding protein YcdF (DUF218 family)
VARPRSSRLKLLAVLLALIPAGYFTRTLWLPIPARLLVRSDPPEKAEIVLLVAGDGSGERLAKAAEMVRAGYAPRILISGPNRFYGHHECDLAIPFAVKRGHPEEWFEHFHHGANSTEEEARLVMPELRRRGIRKFMAVTSNYHSQRTARAFEPHLGGITMVVISSTANFFNPDHWWKSREAQKMLFFEWTKTFAYWIGL